MGQTPWIQPPKKEKKKTTSKQQQASNKLDSQSQK
jgi:hypothetical protein